MTYLAGLLPEGIEGALGLREAFRARQIFEWIAKGAASLDEMTSLPSSLRIDLASKASIAGAREVDRATSDDGSVKLAMELEEGLRVECVLLKDREGRRTACLSTQAGCPMACAFCKTGSLGYARDLRLDEIVEQYRALCRIEGPVGNVVFMGMGEPLLNLGPVLDAIAWLRHPAGPNVSARKITVSTCGITEGIRALADSGCGARLDFSLTTADPALRDSLMPVNRSRPLPELKAAIGYWQEKLGMRVTLEAVILGSVNDSEREARLMAEFVKGLRAQLNLIPWNPVPGLPYRSPSLREIEAFEEALSRRGLAFTRRARRGRGVSGACGQLGSTKAVSG